MAKQPTVEEIKNRLEELGVEYPSDAKKSELLEILNEAVEAPEEKETAEEGESTEEGTERQEDDKTGELSKSDYRAGKRKSKKAENSNEIAHRVIAGKEANTSKLNEKRLKENGVNWYRADARTVLEDGRVTRPGFYYPVHKDEVERVGTFKRASTKKASRKQIESGKFDVTPQGFIIERKPRLVKETPEEGLKRKDAEEAFEANDFIG